MKAKGLCVLCAVLLCSSLALAEEGQQPAKGKLPLASEMQQARPGAPQQAFAETGGTWVSGDTLRDANRPGGRDCAEPYLCGQDEEGTTWLYSDLGFCYQGNCQRVTAEDFPPPGEPFVTAPVGIISFFGTYLNDASGGCVKNHSFRVCFYVDSGGVPVYPAQQCINGVVPAIAEDVGDLNFSGGAAEKFRFTLVLPSAVNVHQPPYSGRGHFSIASDNVQAGCYFLWGPSFPPEGNRLCFRWYESDFTGTFRSFLYDTQYCFAENKEGACCDDCNPGTCDSNSNEFLCNQLGFRFQANVNCAGMTPPCGAFVGTCCLNNGTTLPLTCDECLDPGRPGYDPEDYWIPSTNPDDCCVVACPIGGTPENEPVCDDDYDDVTNPGCNREPPVFMAIDCDDVICGESGTFLTTVIEPIDPCPGDASCSGVVDFGDINPFVDGMLCVGAPDPFVCWDNLYPGCNYLNCDVDGSGTVTFGDINPFVAKLLGPPPPPIPCTTTTQVPAHDTDWYSYTSDEPLSFTWTVNAEFEAYAFMLHAGTAPDLCDDKWYVNEAEAAACNDATITTRVLPAGTYWFGVTTAQFSGVECGRDYTAELTCEQGEPCNYEPCDPNEPGYQLEPEPCGDDTNGGCGDPNDPNDPDLFTTVTFQEVPVGSGQFYAAVCSTSFANLFEDEGEYRRDLDWFNYNLPGQAGIFFSLATEIPLHMTPLFSDGDGNPWFCGADSWGYWTSAMWWDPCNETTPLYTTIKAGLNYVYVFPETAETEALWIGYPCVSGDNTYILRMEYGEPNCPDNIDCTLTDPNLVEGEPPCFDGYIDAYNGGCDVDPPRATKPLPVVFPDEFWSICGVSAAFHQTVDPNSPVIVDSDWYAFTLIDPQWLCITGVSELPIDVDIWGPLATLDCNTILDPNGDPNLQIFNGFYAACAGIDQDPIGGANWDPDPNDPNNENRPQMPAGNYWMRIALQEGFEDITCGLGWEYSVEMTNDRNCPDTSG